MKFSLLRLTPLVLLAVSASAADCNRDCLRSTLTQYLDALVAHKPASVPVAAKVRFTENAVEMKLGEGLWKGASKLAGYRQDILDVREGVAASQVIVEESGTPVMLSVRLKIVDKKVTEIETQVTRTKAEGALFDIAKIQIPTPAFNVTPTAAERNSRADLIRIAKLYPAGLKIGSFVESNTPFAADAYRFENGTTTAGGDCTREGCHNLQTQTIIKHPAVTESVAAVDEEQGIVLLRMNFGDTGSYGAGNSLHVFEGFKIYGGQIHAVEAFMRVMPATQGSGWE